MILQMSFRHSIKYITSSDTPTRFPLLILPASVLMTTIEVKGSCFDVDKCIDVVVSPPPPELLFVVKSRIEVLGKLLVVLFVEDIDFTLLIRPEIAIF